MAATVLGSLLVQLGMDSAEFDRGISRAQTSMKGAERQFTTSGRAIERSNGSMKMGMQQLSFQLNDVATQWASGTRPMQIFAQQSGQVVQAIQLMSNGAGKFGSFMAGPWGMAITAGIVVLSALIPKLLQTEQAMQDVKFASNAMGDAQGILGNVMDLTTGKINTQSSALIALARAQLLVAKVQSQARAAEAQRGVQALQDRPVVVGGGFGGGLTAGRRPMDARDAISRDVLSGKLDPGLAVGRLENVRKYGHLSDNDFAQGASAIANLAVEKANQKVYDEGLKLLDGKGGRSLLKTGGARSRSSGSSKSGSGKSPADTEHEFQAERAGLMQNYNSAMSSMASNAEASADFEMKNLELQRIRTEHAINNNKDYDDAQKKVLIGQVEQLAEVQRAQIERDKQRRLEQERDQAQQTEYQAQREALQIKMEMAGTEKERQAIALELLAIDQQYRRNALEQIIASTVRTDAEKALAQKSLDSLGAVESAEKASTLKGTQTRAQAYLSSLQKTPAQINEAIDNIKIDALQSFNDQLVDAIVNFKSLGDVASSILRQILADLIRLQIQKSIMGPLSSLLGLSGGGGGGSGDVASGIGAGLSALGSIFGGARAGGGPVRLGKSYLVGERGPEIFTPAGSGHIISNDNLPGMGGAVHSPTFVFPGITDAKGAREAAGQAARRYRQEINGPMRRNA